MCGASHFNLKCKYPVNYEQVKIKRSKSKGTIHPVCPCEAHHFEEENPMFTALPDHQLSTLPLKIEQDVLISHSGLQLTPENQGLQALISYFY